MAFHRRRSHDPRRPPISTLAVLLPLFLALLSFLAPPLLDHPAFPEPNASRGQRFLRRDGSSQPFPLVLNNSAQIPRNAVRAEFFRVLRGGGSLGHDLWKSKLSKYFYSCSNSSSKFPKSEAITYSNRYLMIATSGRLNQQRAGITDAVVAARILNATLVVPKLDSKSLWKDASNFTEIFDVDRFISTLSMDVKIIKQLPMKRGKAFASPYTMRVPRKCTPRCY